MIRRPYLDVFLDEIFSKYAVAAWTSANESNADHMFKNTFGVHARKLQFGWSRSQCDVASGRSFVGRKDLRKVWADPYANAHGTWNEQNTILLDDTVAKATFTPANAIHLPTFTVCDPAFDCRNDPSLLSILLYLRQLHASSVEDVRAYMASNPAFAIGPTGLPSVPAYRVDEEFDGEPLSSIRRSRTEHEEDSSSSTSGTSEVTSKSAMKKAAKLAKKLQRKEAGAGASPPRIYQHPHHAKRTSTLMTGSSAGRAGDMAQPAMMAAGARYMQTQSNTRNRNWRREIPPEAGCDGWQYPADGYERSQDDQYMWHGPPQAAHYAHGAPSQHWNRQPPQWGQYQADVGARYPSHGTWQPHYSSQPHPSYPPQPLISQRNWYPPQIPIPPPQHHNHEPMAYPPHANVQYPPVWRPPGRQSQHTRFDDDENDHAETAPRRQNM
ncbi:hypothetical protein HDU86_006191 [Geranomyces michiganensis]|nr:hypothetical protein HDU86_006191 [Geranomyces michiganensis]